MLNWAEKGINISWKNENCKLFGILIGMVQDYKQQSKDADNHNYSRRGKYADKPCCDKCFVTIKDCYDPKVPQSFPLKTNELIRTIISNIDDSNADTYEKTAKYIAQKYGIRIPKSIFKNVCSFMLS